MYQNFISFEGIDGSGKTTQSKMLQAALQKASQPAIWTREIGGTEVAEKLRDIILHDDTLSPRSELLMLMAARSEHLEKLILPALKEGKTVICDRFIDSTAAYQGGELTNDLIFQLHNMLFGSELLPALTFFIDVDPEQSLTRASNRGDITKFERKELEFFVKLRAAFLELSKVNTQRIIVIDGNQSIDAVHKDIMLVMSKRFD